MKALVFQDGRAEVRDVRKPVPARGFALVRVLLSGICNTDLELRRGYHGFSGIPGHEFVGCVEGPAGSPWVGKRVVGEINLACGRCDWCGRGLGRHCAGRRVLGIVGHPGAHAEFLTLPEKNLHEVPGEISDEEAVFTEPLAAACEILDQVAVGRETRAAVLGAGKLGTLCAAVLENAGADVALLKRGSRARARSFDLVVEATGSPAGMPRAIALVRPRGTIVLEIHPSRAGALRRRAARRQRGDRRGKPLRTLRAGARSPAQPQDRRPAAPRGRVSARTRGTGPGPGRAAGGAQSAPPSGCVRDAAICWDRIHATGDSAP
jgi:threonine dehydrogenase-like Zn-dependent dehydrogenase